MTSPNLIEAPSSCFVTSHTMSVQVVLIVINPVKQCKVNVFHVKVSPIFLVCERANINLQRVSFTVYCMMHKCTAFWKKEGQALLFIVQWWQLKVKVQVKRKPRKLAFIAAVTWILAYLGRLRSTTYILYHIVISVMQNVQTKPWWKANWTDISPLVFLL